MSYSFRKMHCRSYCRARSGACPSILPGLLRYLQPVQVCSLAFTVIFSEQMSQVANTGAHSRCHRSCRAGISAGCFQPIPCCRGWPACHPHHWWSISGPESHNQINRETRFHPHHRWFSQHRTEPGRGHIRLYHHISFSLCFFCHANTAGDLCSRPCPTIHAYQEHLDQDQETLAHVTTAHDRSVTSR